MLGPAVTNREAPKTANLDALPVSGKLHIRDLKPEADTAEAG